MPIASIVKTSFYARHTISLAAAVRSRLGPPHSPTIRDGRIVRPPGWRCEAIVARARSLKPDYDTSEFTPLMRAWI